MRTFEKTVIKELIRLILELYTRCYDLNTDMLCRLVMFTNPLSERSKQTLKNKLDTKSKEFIEKMEQFVQLPNKDQNLVKVYTSSSTIDPILLQIKVLNIPVVTAMQACSFFSPGLSLLSLFNFSS